MGEQSNEVKIVFKEDGLEKVLRGVISGEDDFFITLKRMDGVVRIAKSVIIKIDCRGVGGGNGQKAIF